MEHQALEFEREIDFRRWRDAVLARRWFVVAGIVVGLVLGGLYSLGGGGGYQATVVIRPGQPYNPDGTPVLSYSVSPLGIERLVGSEKGLSYAAAAAHMPVGQLRGHATATILSLAADPVAPRGTVLVLVTVSLPQADPTEDVANGFGAYVAKATESLYVKQTIAIYALKEVTLTRRLNVVTRAIDSYNRVIASNITPFDRLVLVASLDDAIAREGTIENSLSATENALALTQNIELSQIVNRAAAAQPAGRSRRTSLIFGGLIGFLTTALAALIIGLREPHPAMTLDA